MIRASAAAQPSQIKAVGGCEVEITAAAETQDGKPVLPKFKGIAYTGGTMIPMGWGDPVVVDLQGIEWTEKSRPILKDHDSALVVGHTTGIAISGNNLIVSGVISGTGPSAVEVRDNAKNGFPWQMSIGAAARKVRRVKAGESVNVNGQDFDGPLYLVEAATLGEISFVALGADDATEAGLAAKAAQDKEMDMKFGEWLQAEYGLKESELSAQQLELFKAKYKASMDAAKKAEESEVEAGADSGKGINASAGKSVVTSSKEDDEDGEAADPIKAIRAENLRIEAIRAVAGKDSEICARAIEKGWTPEQAELAVLKAEKVRDEQDSGVGSPAIVIKGGNKADSNILAAACALSTGLNKPEEHFEEQALDAASSQFKNGIGLQELIMHCAWKNGFHGSSFRSSPREVLQAAFSTNDIDGILSNTANKHLVTAFMAVENTWSSITARRNAVDFKTMTGYRLTGDMQYEQVGNGGELKNGSLGEASYSNKVDTYGKIFSLTRQDMINDDLGALSDLARRLGRGAALKINDVFWTKFLDNSSFFTEARGNYSDGTSTALSIDSLTSAETLFLDQTDEDGKPMAINPVILLVPNALFVTGTQLMNSTELRDTTTSKKYGTNNPHAGKFQVMKSSYLGNSAYTGYSTAAWYLLADPRDVPVIETAFLNGKEQPTVESADADFDTLGIKFRGYHDFGVALQEYRGGVKMLGAASGS